jgi:hypothetical protein
MTNLTYMVNIVITVGHEARQPARAALKSRS